MSATDLTKYPLFVERLVYSPLVILKQTIPDILKTAIQTAVFTPLSVLTLGLNKSINNNAGIEDEKNYLHHVTPNLLKNILLVLNQNAKTSFINLKKSTFDNIVINQKNFYTKHIISRLYCLKELIKEVATRIIYFVPAIFALIAAIVTRGNNIKINKFALDYFNPLAIVSEICRGTRAIINPFQFQIKSYEKLKDPFDGDGIRF